MKLHELARLPPLGRSAMAQRILAGKINQQQAGQRYGDPFARSPNGSPDISAKA